MIMLFLYFRSSEFKLPFEMAGEITTSLFSIVILVIALHYFVNNEVGMFKKLLFVF